MSLFAKAPWSQTVCVNIFRCHCISYHKPLPVIVSATASTELASLLTYKWFGEHLHQIVWELVERIYLFDAFPPATKTAHPRHLNPPHTWIPNRHLDHSTDTSIPHRHLDPPQEPTVTWIPTKNDRHLDSLQTPTHSV